jgi:hypothetical protein
MDELRKHIDKKLQKLGGNYYPASHPSLAIQDKENVPILESIFLILKSFDESSGGLRLISVSQTLHIVGANSL